MSTNNTTKLEFRFFPVLLTTMVALVATNLAARAAGQDGLEPAKWIWSSAEDRTPKNRFTWFRKVVDLSAIPADAALRFAADSNAQLWVNGHILRRKVSRYHEEHITTEVVNAGPYLKTGRNVVVVLHHNWGDIITFQRTANKHAGLYLRSAWLNTDSTWRCTQAPEFMPHDTKIVGVIGDSRIRYPQLIDGNKAISGNLHDPTFDDTGWSSAVIVENGPWPATPTDVETPGQREYPVRPAAVVAAGTANLKQPLSDTPLSIAKGIREAECFPNRTLTQKARQLTANGRWTITGKAGQTVYVTFDFHRPVHGFPYLTLAQAPAGSVVDFGYAEIARSIYSGEMHVKENGWINPEGVVGPGYADRYTCRPGPQHIELPDERTARWLTLHIHFATDGKITIENVGFVKSQYPIRMIGSFACGDPRIDQIVNLCLTHAEITMSDAYVDTPGREDGQWIEDARPRAVLAARWFGDVDLLRLMIRTLAQGQYPDGHLHPFAPSNFPVGAAAYDWSVQWVAMLYDAYMWTGSTENIRPWWPHLVKYWDNVLACVDENGLWRTNRVLADIRVGLHPENPRQSSGIVTPWIIERLRWSSQVAEAMGYTDRAGRWLASADKMTDAFRKYHIVPATATMPAHVADRFDPEKPDLKRGYSQAGQTVAVTAGLLTPEEARADLEYAFPAPDGSPPATVTRWNNPTYGYRVLRALSETGLGERAVAHLLERYGPYLPGHPRNTTPLKLQGPFGGPLPEYWVNRADMKLKPGEKCTAQPADETGTHGWGAVPLLWMHDSLLGVRITEPGGGRIRIAPDTGGLPYVAGHTVTPKGTVWVYWDPQQWRLEVTLPAGVQADLVPPAACKGKRLVPLASPGPLTGNADTGLELNTAGNYVFQVR